MEYQQLTKNKCNLLTDGYMRLKYLLESFPDLTDCDYKTKIGKDSSSCYTNTLRELLYKLVLLYFDNIV